MKKITQDAGNQMQDMKVDKKIFGSLEDLFTPEQKIIWFALKTSALGHFISHRSISSLLYPGKEYKRAQKTMVSRRIITLEDSNYVESLDYCLKCGSKFKSIPEECPYCNTPLTNDSSEKE